MKRIVITTLVAIGFCVLQGLNSLSPASATTLCKNNSSTELCTERYSASTKVQAVLASGTTWVLNTEFKKIECKESAFELTIKKEGGSTETADLERVKELGKLTGGCNCDFVVLKNPNPEIHSISGSDNGLIKLSGTELTTWCNTFFGVVHCLYGVEDENTATLTGGTLKGGNPAKLEVEGEMLFPFETSFACSGEATLKATYEITSPTPLYVASG